MTLASSGSRQGPVARCCQHSTMLWGSVRGWVVTIWLFPQGVLCPLVFLLVNSCQPVIPKHRLLHISKLTLCGTVHLALTVKNASWIKIDQLDVTCFIISLFTAQHVSNFSTFTFRSLRLIVDLSRGLYCSGSMCVGVTVWFGWGGVVSLCRLKH